MAINIALAGNPNCGKTTMFNALTGANQYVGNWPGVTVEKKEGKLKGKRKGEDITITDLPGIYSLSPYTLEEVVSRDFLLNENPDVIIDLVDATNIERNLYLTTQLIETCLLYTSKPEFEDMIHQILTMMMAECSKAFEQLPLIDDIDILRNVLYSGVWYRYEQVREKREKEKEEKNV